ncbi:hypothetical protein BVX95_01035 [archaeon D22]|nr:hypothetical protein BVX95_01035 [archaeon D22]
MVLAKKMFLEKALCSRKGATPHDELDVFIDELAGIKANKVFILAKTAVKFKYNLNFVIFMIKNIDGTLKKKSKFQYIPC